jgi:hypothetical protein
MHLDTSIAGVCALAVIGGFSRKTTGLKTIDLKATDLKATDLKATDLKATDKGQHTVDFTVSSRWSAHHGSRSPMQSIGEDEWLSWP